MSTLHFMPWCRINKTYSAGEINIIPFQQGASIDGLGQATNRQVQKILASYKDLEGHPIQQASLMHFNDRPLLMDLSDDDLEVMHECVDIVCFCSLANRKYFDPLGPYCNADCFIWYGQKFSGSDFVAITSKRREGRNVDGRPLAETVFSIPVHVNPVQRIFLDVKLLDSLMAFRKETSDDEWVRWQSAISCFNQANTDSDAIRYQVEWVLLCSAFERILGAKPKAEVVAQKFSETLIPATPLLVRDSHRWKGKDQDKHLRYEWMKECYRIRGNFAHGRLKTQQPAVWKPLEHIVLSSIAFPLMVKSLLHKKGKYELTDKDLAEINSFERLIDEQFLENPPDKENSSDSVWSRLVAKAKWDLMEQRGMEALEANGIM